MGKKFVKKEKTKTHVLLENNQVTRMSSPQKNKPTKKKNTNRIT